MLSTTHVLSQSTKSHPTTKSPPTTVVLETVNEPSTEGVSDQILSTTQVTTESHPTQVGMETGKEPSTKEGAPDKLSEGTKSEPMTVATQVLSLGTKSPPSTVVLEPGKESS